MRVDCVDISTWNSGVNYNAVRSDGIVAAILRAGYGKLVSQKDIRFEQNYAECRKHGIPVGAYWYSYALTPSEAAAEALAFQKIIDGKQLEYPVWFDIEERSALNTGMKNCSAMIRAFCTEMEKADYWCGVYCSRSGDRRETV